MDKKGGEISGPRLAIKVDVDTDRGTRIGVPCLVDLFEEFGIRATFLFSLGPDNTGRAIKRLFRAGFFRKVSRTGVVSLYGLRTLMNGILLPGPFIGRRNEGVMRMVAERGHEAGIHCYDHIKWQDGLAGMDRDKVFQEFGKARREYERIFGTPARSAGAAGWQANGYSLEACDEAGLLYASDARGTHPFFPRDDRRTYRTLQVPTTLPTLDELLGRPEYPEDRITDHYVSLLRSGGVEVLTVHAEIEGMSKIGLFRSLLRECRSRHVRFLPLREVAKDALAEPGPIPVCDLVSGTVDGRSGMLGLQRCSS